MALPVHNLTVEDILKWHSLPKELITALSGGTLASGLERLLTFGELPVAPGKPIAFSGASGSGKTMALAKLAVRLSQQNVEGQKPPLVVACDTTPGSFAKLVTILDPYNVQVIDGKDLPNEIPEILKSRRTASRRVLVDLPGVCIYNQTAMSRISDIIRVLNSSLCVVIPAGMDPEEAADIASAMSMIGGKYVIGSRLEQSGRIGGLLTAAACGLKMTYGSHSEHITKGFSLLTPNVAAKRLLNLPS
ncbi:P-loop NTPase family protein [Acetobacter persici]|uniref:hypothetical protein n=1 Tax=Acetobacter persici TaxID=1076596 RepID=UPI001AD7F477|nr:hypothetical protein [Acetobacter persici]